MGHFNPTFKGSISRSEFAKTDPISPELRSRIASVYVSLKKHIYTYFGIKYV